MTVSYYGTGRHRRLDIEWAGKVVSGGNALLTAGVVCFMLPALLGLVTSVEADIVRWAAWSAASVGVTGMALLWVALAMWLAPRQATGAAVEAMVMQGPDEGLILFREQPVSLAALRPLQPPARPSDLEQQSRAAVSDVWRRVWRRSTRPALFDAPVARPCFLARRLLEPLS